MPQIPTDQGSLVATLIYRDYTYLLVLSGIFYGCCLGILSVYLAVLNIPFVIHSPNLVLALLPLSSKPILSYFEAV